MINKALLLLVISIAACGMANAGLLQVSAPGQFSSFDTAALLVTPSLHHWRDL